MRFKYNPFLCAIIFCIVALIISGFIGKIINENKYNNGLCINCGGTYEFKQAVGSYAGIGYMYICNKCGRMIEINKYYPPNN